MSVLFYSILDIFTSGRLIELRTLIRFFKVEKFVLFCLLSALNSINDFLLGVACTVEDVVEPVWVVALQPDRSFVVEGNDSRVNYQFDFES